MLIVDCRIPGKPQPKERPRLGRGGVRSGSRTSAWENGAALIIRNVARLRQVDAPIHVDLCIVHDRPSRRPRYVDPEVWATGARIPRDRTPDFDNVVKAMMDAANAAGIWTDDARVWRATVEQYTAGSGERAGVRFRAWVTDLTPCVVCETPAVVCGCGVAA